MEQLNKCLICGSKVLKKFLLCKDHFLTKETFSIVECNNCGFRFTNPRPFSYNLNKYYKSEEYISHSNTKKGIINKIYQLVRNYTINKKFNLINNLGTGKSIIDIGCATGEFLNYFKKNNWKTIGIEPNENARNFAIRNFNLDIKDEDSIKEINNNSFDIITMWHVLEHVPLLNERISEIRRILKNDGYLIVAVPNCNSFDARIYKEFWAAYDVPRHLYHFTQSSVESLFKKHCLAIDKIIPMKFDSFYVSLLSEKYKTGKQNFHKAFFNGIKSNYFGRKNDNNYSSLIFVITNHRDTNKNLVN